jgi:eukaryotic-like serine/threonine-protein kinase
VSIKSKFILVMLTVLVLGAILVTGCTGGVAQGWAGGVASNGKIFIASMKGKLIAIDTTGSQLKSLGTSVQLTTTAASGGLSCVPSCSAQSAGLVIYSSLVVSDAKVTDTQDPDYGLVYQVAYVGGTDGKIYAYALKKGVWSKDAEYIYPRQGSMTGAIIGDLILDNNTIYFATSDGSVYALNAKDLSLKWSNPYKINSKIWSAPAVDGDTLYIGCFDKTVYAINTTDGTEKWKYKTDGAVNSTPVIYNNTVFIGDYSRHFYALDAATGNQVWIFPANDTGAGNPKNFFWAKPVLLNGVIYATNLDGNVYALDSSTGKLVNTFILGDSIASSPVVVGTNIVVATSVSSYAPSKQKVHIYIIDTSDGSKKEVAIPDKDVFKNAAINAPLFTDGNTVYVHTTRDALWEIDVTTKTIKQSPPFSLVSETYQ